MRAFIAKLHNGYINRGPLDISLYLQPKRAHELKYLQPKFVGIVIRLILGILKRNTNLIEYHLRIGSALDMIIVFVGVLLHPQLYFIGELQSLIPHFGRHGIGRVLIETEVNHHRASVLDDIIELHLNRIEELFGTRLDGLAGQFADIVGIELTALSHLIGQRSSCRNIIGRDNDLHRISRIGQQDIHLGLYIDIGTRQLYQLCFQIALILLFEDSTLRGRLESRGKIDRGKSPAVKGLLYLCQRYALVDILLTGQTAEIARILNDGIDLVQSQIEAVQDELVSICLKHPLEAIAWLSMPGVGLVNAATLIAYVGDGSRFSKPEQLMNYAGLVPRLNQSGITNIHGTVTKMGCRCVRRNIVQGASSILTHKYNPSCPLSRFA